MPAEFSAELFSSVKDSPQFREQVRCSMTTALSILRTFALPLLRCHGHILVKRAVGQSYAGGLASGLDVLVAALSSLHTFAHPDRLPSQSHAKDVLISLACARGTHLYTKNWFVGVVTVADFWRGLSGSETVT